MINGDRAVTNSRLNDEERASGATALKSYPKILQVEISASCNLKCNICARNEFEYGPGNLPIDLFRSLAFLFPYLEKLILHGYGEPLAHPEFAKIMEIVAPYSCHKSFYTNGTLLTEEKSRNIIAGGIDEVTVSIDSPVKETFEAIRTGASFDRVKKNVERLVEMRNGTGGMKPKVVIAAVAMVDNVDELPSLVDFVNDIGADAVEINYLIAYKEPLVKRSLFFDKDGANAALKEVKARCEALGIEARLPDSFLTGNGKKERTPEKMCPRPYDFAYVGYDGNVRPCCFPLLYLGNIVKDPFSDIWNNKKYQKLRRSFNENRPPSFCRECLSGTYTDVNSEKCHISCRLG
ncbi:MAG: SPASM domain-containing protein [Deltaproteobacteria bacterium]|uniref:SPASM domain-containing protein n=1 Tax=Candidatus Zymogenus saltonus TaxID=2844893 RepID=A0A9D8KGX4_9DELT|nr:SPASM domain-containing protein [Candidatus Zymogenus saltonus]